VYVVKVNGLIFFKQFFDAIILLFLAMEVDEEDDLLNEHYMEGVDVALLIATLRNDPIPENTSPYTGKLYTNWLMNSAGDNAFFYSSSYA